MFTQSIKFYRFHHHILKSIQMFEKCDSSNSKIERLLLSASFTAKFELVFVLTLEILNVFNTSTLKQVFWKTKTFFKKLEYPVLVKSTKIENASFLYKTALLEANVKTNRIVSTKWTYHKERSFASNYFIFLNLL